MMNKKKNLLVMTVLMGVLLLTMLLPAFAEPLNRGLPYLHIEGALESDAFQFNEKGVYVEQTDPPQALQRGWVVLSSFDPIVIKSSNVTILLQKESVLSVVSDNKNDLKFYLVAGSASFLRDETYLGKMNVHTPIGIYDVMGPGELFVSSDISELVFSLGSSVQVTNTITRKKTTLSPYHYLDLADPFLKEKEISKQTYTTLSINQEMNTSSLLPSSAVKDGLSITKIATLPSPVVKEEVKATPPVVKEEVKKPAPVEKKEEVKPEPVEAKVTPPVEKQAAPPVVTQDVVEQVYIIHTNDAYGTIDESAIPYPVLATLLKWKSI
ncbi:MAG: hypothetical protein EOM67_08865, partial [Spirochaetia bacterium]|nr:hypothetical protein [Spirochaetia bacterium]